MDIFSPLQWIANQVTYSILRTTPHSYLGDTVNFFIYESLKIGIMLIVINYFMAVIRFYLPMEKVRDILTKRRWLGLDYLIAASLGVITPFCSCSSIPLFLGFLSARIPLGVTFAFLIASPLVNESSLYLFPALFGLKLTVIYNLLGIGVAIVGGMIIQKLKVERFIKPEIRNLKTKQQVEAVYGGMTLTIKEQLVYFWHDGMRITKEIFGYVLIGVGFGSLIHGFVPTIMVERYLVNTSWWSIPAATFSGAPLYANSVSVLPVMEALINKGVPVGTALAFMTGIVTVSIPQTLILNKVMGWKLLSVFLGITIVGIMLMGYVLNWLL